MRERMVLIGSPSNVNLNRRLARMMALWSAAIGAAVPLSATANCWGDPAVSQRAFVIATRHFPEVANSMPAVVVCDQLPNGWTAMHTNGEQPRISIADWAVRNQDITGILGHELAHHQVMLDGQIDDRSLGGHGLAFMRALIRGGLADEARRVAKAVAGADQALAQAEAELMPNRVDAPQPRWGSVPAPIIYQPTVVRLCTEVWVPVQPNTHRLILGQIRWVRSWRCTP